MDQSTKQPRHRSLTREGNHSHFVFGPKIRPAMSASRSEVIKIETQDCYQGQITDDPATHNQLLNEKQIPVTGPVYVDDADIGDVLCVHIQQIELANKGVFVISPKTGVIGQDIQKQIVRVYPVKSNHLNLANGINVPLNPVVGIIGVAPRHGEIDTIYPGRHGGNMDTLEITTGSRIYLPVQVKGALLSIGDVKASLSDGQIAGSGVESAAEVTLRIDTLPGGKFSWPRVETKDAWITITSASSVNQASRLAVSEMIRWLEQEKGLDFETAYTLVSVSGALRISQWNNPLITARIVFPKSIVQKIRSKSAPSGRPMFLTSMPEISREDEDKAPVNETMVEAVAEVNVESVDPDKKNDQDESESAVKKSPSSRPPRRRRRRVSSNRRNASKKKATETSTDSSAVVDGEKPLQNNLEAPTTEIEADKALEINKVEEINEEKPITKSEEPADSETAEPKPAVKRRPARKRPSTRRSSSNSSAKRRSSRKPAQNTENENEAKPDQKNGPEEKKEEGTE